MMGRSRMAVDLANAQTVSRVAHLGVLAYNSANDIGRFGREALTWFRSWI